MNGLDSGLKAVHLPVAELPPFKAHHEAKHKLLREYIQVWLPKLGYTYNRVAIVDCFASAGRYQRGQPGSPLYLLNAYVGMDPGRKPLKNPPHFILIESKLRFARHLRAEVDVIGGHSPAAEGRIGR